MTEQGQGEATPAAEPAREPAGVPAIGTSVVLTVLAPFAVGYILSYLLRAVNAVVAPDLVSELGLSAADLGLLTAAYLGAFALFQLPLGVLLDRYGPRRVQATLFAVAAAGCALFAVGTNTLALTLARAMIGAGFAGGLMSSFKAIVLWVPAPRRALANAYVMSFGALGLVMATAPTEFAARLIGWRAMFGALAAITAAVALVILTVVPERKAGPAAETLARQVRQLGIIFSDRAFLAIAPLLATTAGTHIAIQTLWAGPWFRDVARLDRAGVAGWLLLVGVAFFAGILSSGAAADRLVRRGVGELTTMLGFLLLFLVAQAAILLEVEGVPRLVAWFALGMYGQVAILAYPWLARRFGVALSGRANTAMNLLIFLCAFAAQYGIGAIIALFPPGPAGGYEPAAYQVAFGACLGVQIVCLGVYLANWRVFRSG